MDKNVILENFEKFSPPWLAKPNPTRSIIEILQSMMSQVLPGLLEIKVEELDSEKIMGSMPYKKETANTMGLMHGGALFTLGDTLGGTFIWANTIGENYSVTIGSEIKYLKPVKEGVVICTVKHKTQEGKKVALEAIFHNEGRLVCIMTLHYLLMERPI